MGGTEHRPVKSAGVACAKTAGQFNPANSSKMAEIGPCLRRREPFLAPDNDVVMQPEKVRVFIGGAGNFANCWGAR